MRKSIQKSRTYVKDTIALFKKQSGLLLLVSSPKLGREQLDLTREVIAAGSVVLTWIAAYTAAKDKRDDAWILDRLLEQAGARTTPRISTLLTASLCHRIIQKPTTSIASVKGRAGSVQARLRAALEMAGVSVVRSGADLSLKVLEEGEIILKSKGREAPLDEDPASVAEALSLLLPGPMANDGRARASFEFDQLEVARIVQPPKRLLSETASKKLARAFGLVTPREQLCRSPSEAVRFAKTLGGPKVLKLVKPRLTKKREKRAVITDVEGAAQTRRAACDLESRGDALGPPKSLGILVAEQIPSKAHLSLEMVDHPMFGRLVLGSKGDTLTDHPVLALLAPATCSEALAALEKTGLGVDTTEREKLALGVSRFSSMIYELGLEINRAEIHPLVTSKDLDDPLVLDALISISSVG